jgi:probable HAF family extracellular repeat protein
MLLSLLATMELAWRISVLGEGSSWAYGINDFGQVVGWSNTIAGDTHTFITGPYGRHH